jgi:mannose-1-phosphate guanylyltransferase
MNALLLAAGLGTRLRPFTFFRAKAALPLLNVPFIHYPLQYLSANHIEDVVINLHAHPESVKQAAGNDYAAMTIAYSHEPEILGTAGAIAKASPMLGQEPFVVMNGDMLLDIPLQHVIEQHRLTNALVTLVVMNANEFQKYGGLYFDGTPLRLTGIRNGSGEKYHYTGVQIVSPEIVQWIPPDKKCDVFANIYPQLIDEQRICGVLYDGMWKEIGTLKQYLQTNLELCKEPLPEHLRPPEMSDTPVSKDSNIENGSNVFESVVMDGAIITDQIEVQHSIIGWDVTVARNVKDVALARGILPWHII